MVNVPAAGLFRPMDFKPIAIATIVWRAIKLLIKASWAVLGFVGLMVTLDTGWPQFTGDVRRSGVLGWLERVWNAVVALLSTNVIGCLTLLVTIAILIHLLVERPRDRSRTEAMKARKKRPSKRKGSKK